MSLLRAVYCGPWEWPHHFQRIFYSPCAIPTLRVLSAHLPHRLHLFFIRLKRWPNTHSIFFVRKFVFCVLPCLPWCHFPIFMCHLVSNLLAWGSRVRGENAVHRQGICSSPSKMFELPSYATELANLLAEAPSPPPSRIRPFNNLVLDFLDIDAK